MLGFEEELQTQMRNEDIKAAHAKEHDLYDVVDSNFNKGEVIEACKDDVNFLATLAMPTIFEFFFPQLMLSVWSVLQKQLQELKEFPQLALGIPRGHAKTTMMKIFVLYCILFSNCRFILILCATEEHAISFIKDVISMLEERNIRAVFGDWSAGITTNRASVKDFFFRGRPIVLAGLGKGGAVRGLNVNHARPDLMIFDDVQTKEDAKSDTVSNDIMTWMIGTAMKAKSPRGCMFVFIGNMYPGENSILRKLKTNPTWISFIAGAILADGTAIWEELRSKASLVKELQNDLAMGHPEIFFSEVMNDTEVSVNNAIDLSAVAGWPYGDTDIPQGRFIIIDPASGKKDGDPVSIGLFEVYDRTPALKQLECDILSPGNTIRTALLMALETNTRCIIAEATGYQSTLLFWFKEVSENLGLSGFFFLEINAGNKNKNGRIIDMLRSLTQDEIHIHSHVRDRVIHQISNFNPLRRDNNDGILDLLSYSQKAIEKYPSEILIVDVAAIYDPSSSFVPDTRVF